MKIQTINMRNHKRNLLLLLLRGKLKNGIVRVRKKCLYSVIWYHLYWEEQFSIDREDTSTEQEKNKYYISKTFLYQWLEDMYFAALNAQALKKNLLLLICNDNVYLIVKDVFSEL